MKTNVSRFLSVLVAIAPLGVFANGWNWAMPGSVYKDLDYSVRASVDRAVRLFDQANDAERRGTRITDLIPRYRAAVAEWRKVQIQAEAGDFDETLIAYATFMQAYARERARDRNEAIKLYGEIIDLHPDVDWVLIPAKFRLACCRLSLGETRKGNAAIDEFIADPAHEGHALMANALDMKAKRLWDEGKFTEAIETWRRVVDPVYAKSNSDSWGSVRNWLIVVSLANADLECFDEVVFAGVGDGDKARYETCRWAADFAFGIFGGGWSFGDHCRRLHPKDKVRNEKIAKSHQLFVKWLEDARPIFGKTGHETDHLFLTLRACACFETPARTAECFEKVKAYLRAEKDEKAVNGRCYQAMDALLAGGKHDLARTVPDLMKGALSQCWMRYEIESRLSNWKSAAAHLEEYIARKPGPAELKKARWTLAGLYRQRLGRIEDAVKIYTEIDEPPASLWALEDCYRSLGKKKESYQLLDEIASIFASDAPRAVITQARHREEDGDKKTAIALYRRLLSHPEWKKSGESSAAHQALERLGVATGGAMTNEVR